MLFCGVELVADAPDGLQRPLVGDAFEFFTKPLDVDVYGT